MVSFVMVVFDERVNRTAQRAFANENQSIQARFLDRPHEALRVRVEIWRTWGQADRFDASRSQGVTKRVGEAWISIVKEETFPSQASINRIRELATALDHPGTVRLGEDTGNLHPSRRQVDHEQDREARQLSFAKTPSGRQPTHRKRQMSGLPWPIDELVGQTRTGWPEVIRGLSYQEPIGYRANDGRLHLIRYEPASASSPVRSDWPADLRQIPSFY
jgi:hypothetical protein